MPPAREVFLVVVRPLLAPITTYRHAPPDSPSNRDRGSGTDPSTREPRPAPPFHPRTQSRPPGPALPEQLRSRPAQRSTPLSSRTLRVPSQGPPGAFSDQLTIPHESGPVHDQPRPAVFSSDSESFPPLVRMRYSPDPGIPRPPDRSGRRGLVVVNRSPTPSPSLGMFHEVSMSPRPARFCAATQVQQRTSCGHAQICKNCIRAGGSRSA